MRAAVAEFRGFEVNGVQFRGYVGVNSPHLQGVVWGVALKKKRFTAFGYNWAES